jgi:glycosyltransferase involved in cell wall biosynthesis
MTRQPPASITAFFPCYNDAATIGGLVMAAGEILARLTDDFEVVVVNDGSEDTSAEVLAGLQRRLPYLRTVTHAQNRGYGAALRSGFGAACKELVFYTDGDGQYDPGEIEVLHASLTPDIGMVQGWKMERQDAWHRKLAGRAYHHAVRWLFDLHVRDVDCDFRLVRRSVVQGLDLTSDSGSITVELVARVEQAGFKIREVPVHHYPRLHGRSQFFNVPRITQTFWQLGALWLELHVAAPVPDSAISVAGVTRTQSGS